MSDSIEELTKHYEENVQSPEYPRSVGLFTIPEYPEFEKRGMWSTALEAILTTLRYLAPATLLTLFWGQQSFLFKLLKHIDSAFRSIVFSSDEQKEAVLRWLAEVGPVRVEHLDTVWRHGWILCGVLDGALPGACAGHPPTRLSLKHAQTIADNYLGVEPVFSRQELESCDSLSKHQEWRLATYLDRIRLALAKLTPPVSRPTSQRTSPDNKPDNTLVTLDYVARGSGLTAAQVNKKVYFKIYPTAQQSLDPGEITILIRGPKHAYGMSILPPILGKAQLIRQKLLGLESKPNFTENALPITHGATYLRNYGKNDMNKTYFIPKTNYDIEIDIEIREDHARVGYTVNCLGIYEISITSRGQSIVGSPFKATASNNMIGVLEKESFCLEDGEEIDVFDVKTDRKVVLRIVDFVTEKMLLRENGCLEKITDEEAKYLLQTDNIDITNFKSKLEKQTTGRKGRKQDIFSKAANKIIKMNRVCNIFNEIKNEKAVLLQKQSTHVLPKSQQDIPDIVNSTFIDSNVHVYSTSEKQNRVIIPESISVSLMTEKSKLCQEDNQSLNEELIFHSPDYLEKYKILREPFEDDELSVSTTQSSNNPFINDMYNETYATEKKMGCFLPREYETNNSQNEETEDGSLKIIINNQTGTLHTAAINPFVDLNMPVMERPKSPVYKIIAGKTQKRADSLYIDCKGEDTIEESQGNEFINPFFAHRHQPNQCNEPPPVTDFIIGAPVSLPPILRATSPEPHLDSIVLSTDSGILDNQNIDKLTLQNDSRTLLSTDSLQPAQCESSSSGHSSFHTSSSSDSYESKVVSHIPLPSISPKKDTWDSAYVSIDDNSSSPDNNNNNNSLSEPLNKQMFPPSDELSAMGPAEREIWETCTELKENIQPFKIHEDTRISKRPSFTTILEENDRSTDMKDSVDETDTDPVTTAFSELNEIFEDYFTREDESDTPENIKSQNLEVDYTIERNDICVDSASGKLSDVKRPLQKIGGEISEVQASVTESDSASQILHVEDGEKCLILNNTKNNNNTTNNTKKDELQFGDRKYSNIVSEKKKYWDEKIRQIQANSDEIKAQQKKRKLYSKPLKHNDSLSKKKGKQMIKNFLTATDDYQKYAKPVNVKQTDYPTQETQNFQFVTEQQEPNVKLVEKWKSFWDNKLEIEKETEINHFKSKPQKEPLKTIENLIQSMADPDFNLDDEENMVTSSNRHELPEEVFIAFETSPKRFFGTSRKQILSKIDTFLGKPNDDENYTSEMKVTGHETGLVSSRISLFHSISRTEELPWARRKCKSLHNLNQQKKCENSTALEEPKITSSITKSVNDICETSSCKSEKSDLIFDNTSGAHENILSEKVSDITLPESCNKSDDFKRDQNTDNNIEIKDNCVKQAIKELSENNDTYSNFKSNKLKTAISKSEMDIFNKVSNKSSEEELDKHKSYEELPKICVKNFISLYEGASKSSLEPKSPKFYSKNKFVSQKSLKIGKAASSDSGTHTLNTLRQESLPEQLSSSTSGSDSNSTNSQKTTISRNITPDSISDSIDIEINSNQDQDCNYLSLSDIDLEIVDKSPETSTKSSPEPKIETENIEYKNRFQIAKQYFQSLEELREEKKSRKLNECEMLLYGTAKESLTDNKSIRQPEKIKKKLKSISLPSSELSDAWNELTGKEVVETATKMVKISEKFNVEDLFSDVMEGRLSRQGSLRGIPHKKAVLEAFKSMENISDKKLSSYEMAVSQLNDFTIDNHIRNAQTYLSEYPYLPTTDPSKYHSRVDTSASGLISFKELVQSKPRRNSVPDLRLNPTFTVDL